MEALPALFDAETSPQHLPVMKEEVLVLLRPQSGGRFVDGTLGGGGHAFAILVASSPQGTLLGVDQDAAALSSVASRLSLFGERVLFRHDNFSQISTLLEEIGWNGVDGVLLDLGFSSLQVDDGDRGFSFLRFGPLDMRMNRCQSLTAADIINGASEEELKKIFREFGEEPAAGLLARAIVRARAAALIETTHDLVSVIGRVLPPSFRSHIHPATRAFQALRIAVNKELIHLATFLQDGYLLLRPGGRMVILTYHSLEDRLVKAAFRRWAATCICPPQLPVCACSWTPQVRILTPKPLAPSREEIAVNPRSRSAHLRAVERLSIKGQ